MRWKKCSAEGEGGRASAPRVERGMGWREGELRVANGFKELCVEQLTRRRGVSCEVVVPIASKAENQPAQRRARSRKTH